MSALQVIRDLWACGVREVWPGTLGMLLEGHVFSGSAASRIAHLLKLRWRSDPRSFDAGHGCIVLEREP